MSIRQVKKNVINVSIRLKDMTLKQIFISNLKKRRKELGISQMALSLLCDTTSNYIGQIEMGRRIPSFEKIEQIASALEIPSYELFVCINEGKKDAKKPKTKPKMKDYLLKMPPDVKKEIISHLLSEIKKNINTSFDLSNY
jgi:transcriptional regulator with XRE-family HTH domain